MDIEWQPCFWLETVDRDLNQYKIVVSLFGTLEPA